MSQESFSSCMAEGYFSFFSSLAFNQQSLMY